MKPGPAQQIRGDRGRPAVITLRWIAVLMLALSVGCGGDTREVEDLGFVELPGTDEAPHAAPLLKQIEPYRMENGAVRVRGTIDLPDRTRLQITIRNAAQAIVGRVQVIVQDRGFDSSPMLGEHGPLPKERYRVEALAFFNDTWQEPGVMGASDAGRNLHGPGMTVDATGAPVFRAVVERTF